MCRRAIEEKYYRSSLIEERIREMITDGTILVDVAGEAVGQVNGLAVMDLGDIRFGRPSRITAKTFMGKSGVIDIERESKMSGKIYDKGVLILSGYLGSRYRAGTAPVCCRQPLFRTIVRRDRRRQRFLYGAVCAAFKPFKNSH